MHTLTSDACISKINEFEENTNYWGGGFYDIHYIKKSHWLGPKNLIMQLLTGAIKSL